MWEDYREYLSLINNCGPNDPLISNTPLGDRLSGLQLANVYNPDFLKLVQNLNLEQIVPTNSGFRRDYRGLAELMGFTVAEVDTFFKRSYNPVKSVIDQFIRRNPDTDINKLLKLIEKIERFDIIDDMIPTLIEIVTENRVIDYAQDRKNLKCYKESNDYQRGRLTDSLDRLTIDDSMGMISNYDAFICYAPEDSDHAIGLIEFLRANNITAATAEDLLPGNFEHDAMVKLIDSRCRKVIIILTPNFSHSKECEFQTKFASELGVKSSSPKIIPIIYEPCHFHELPRLIEVSTKIDMTNKATRPWKEKMLIRSLNPDIKFTNQANQESDKSRYQQGPQQISMAQGRLSPINHDLHNRPMPLMNSLSGSIDQDIDTTTDPIVEVMLSNASTISMPRVSASTSGSLGSSKPKTWFNGLKSVTRRVLRTDQSSTNSRLALLSPQLSDDYNAKSR